MSVYLNRFETEGEVIVAICDEEILGKCFEEKEKQIHIREGFYKGELVSLDQGLEAMREATIANIVGKRIVTGALKARLIHERAIIRIQNIPHAQLVVVK